MTNHDRSVLPAAVGDMSSASGGCIVVDVGSAVPRALTVALANTGFTVALVSEEASGREGAAVACNFGTRAEVEAAFDRATTIVGTPRLFVLSLLPSSFLVAESIDTAPNHRWTDTMHEAALGTLFALQGCHRLLKKSGGTIVMIGPALSLVGAPRLTALATLLEAQRALVKSAARQWGKLGIRAHWVALGIAGNYDELDITLIPLLPEVGPPVPAIGRVPHADTDIAPLIAFLAGSGAAALTGMTLVADGGNWMVP